jgi:predicted ATPase
MTMDTGRIKSRAADHTKQRRIVLTGGPGAGKTAVLELARRVFCHHVATLKEAASIVFGGGFPREPDDSARRAAQRAIFHVQVELERMVEDRHDALLVLCDRGTVDGLAYWPGDGESFWRSLGTSLEDQLARYDAVIHLRPPPAGDGYEKQGIRLESATEAAHLDARIMEAWARHPRRFMIESTHDFLEKVSRTIALIGEELPPACRDQPMHAAKRLRPVSA